MDLQNVQNSLQLDNLLTALGPKVLENAGAVPEQAPEAIKTAAAADYTLLRDVAQKLADLPAGSDPVHLLEGEISAHNGDEVYTTLSILKQIYLDDKVVLGPTVTVNLVNDKGEEVESVAKVPARYLLLQGIQVPEGSDDITLSLESSAAFKADLDSDNDFLTHISNRLRTGAILTLITIAQQVLNSNMDVSNTVGSASFIELIDSAINKHANLQKAAGTTASMLGLSKKDAGFLEKGMSSKKAVYFDAIMHIEYEHRSAAYKKLANLFTHQAAAATKRLAVQLGVDIDDLQQGEEGDLTATDYGFLHQNTLVFTKEATVQSTPAFTRSKLFRDVDSADSGIAEEPSAAKVRSLLRQSVVTIKRGTIDHLIGNAAMTHPQGSGFQHIFKDFPRNPTDFKRRLMEGFYTAGYVDTDGKVDDGAYADEPIPYATIFCDSPPEGPVFHGAIGPASFARITSKGIQLRFELIDPSNARTLESKLTTATLKDQAMPELGHSFGTFKALKAIDATFITLGKSIFNSSFAREKKLQGRMLRINDVLDEEGKESSGFDQATSKALAAMESGVGDVTGANANYLIEASLEASSRYRLRPNITNLQALLGADIAGDSLTMQKPANNGCLGALANALLGVNISKETGDASAVIDRIAEEASSGLTSEHYAAMYRWQKNETAASGKLAGPLQYYLSGLMKTKQFLVYYLERLANDPMLSATIARSSTRGELNVNNRIAYVVLIDWLTKGGAPESVVSKLALALDSEGLYQIDSADRLALYWRDTSNLLEAASFSLDSKEARYSLSSWLPDFINRTLKAVHDANIEILTKGQIQVYVAPHPSAPAEESDGRTTAKKKETMNRDAAEEEEAPSVPVIADGVYLFPYLGAEPPEQNAGEADDAYKGRVQTAMAEQRQIAKDSATLQSLFSALRGEAPKIEKPKCTANLKGGTVVLSVSEFDTPPLKNFHLRAFGGAALPSNSTGVFNGAEVHGAHGILTQINVDGDELTKVAAKLPETLRKLIDRARAGSVGAFADLPENLSNVLIFMSDKLSEAVSGETELPPALQTFAPKVRGASRLGVMSKYLAIAAGVDVSRTKLDTSWYGKLAEGMPKEALGSKADLMRLKAAIQGGVEAQDDASDEEALKALENNGALSLAWTKETGGLPTEVFNALFTGGFYKIMSESTDKEEARPAEEYKEARKKSNLWKYINTKLTELPILPYMECLIGALNELGIKGDANRKESFGKIHAILDSVLQQDTLVSSGQYRKLPSDGGDNNVHDILVNIAQNKNGDISAKFNPLVTASSILGGLQVSVRDMLAAPGGDKTLGLSNVGIKNVNSIIYTINKNNYNSVALESVSAVNKFVTNLLKKGAGALFVQTPLEEADRKELFRIANVKFIDDYNSMLQAKAGGKPVPAGKLREQIKDTDWQTLSYRCLQASSKKDEGAKFRALANVMTSSVLAAMGSDVRNTCINGSINKVVNALKRSVVSFTFRGKTLKIAYPEPSDVNLPKLVEELKGLAAVAFGDDYDALLRHVVHIPAKFEPFLPSDSEGEILYEDPDTVTDFVNFYKSPYRLDTPVRDAFFGTISSYDNTYFRGTLGELLGNPGPQRLTAAAADSAFKYLVTPLPGCEEALQWFGITGDDGLAHLSDTQGHFDALDAALGGLSFGSDKLEVEEAPAVSRTPKTMYPNEAGLNIKNLADKKRLEALVKPNFNALLKSIQRNTSGEFALPSDLDATVKAFPEIAQATFSALTIDQLQRLFQAAQDKGWGSVTRILSNLLPKPAAILPAETLPEDTDKVLRANVFKFFSGMFDKMAVISPPELIRNKFVEDHEEAFLEVLKHVPKLDLISSLHKVMGLSAYLKEMITDQIAVLVAAEKSKNTETSN